MVNKIIKEIVAISFLGTVTDYFWTHLLVFENMPELLSYFFVVKFLASAIIIYFTYEFFRNKYNESIAQNLGILTGIALHVAFVQLYYGIYPIPLQGGGEIVIGSIKDSFIQGYPDHFADFGLSFLIIKLGKLSNIIKFNGR